MRRKLNISKQASNVSEEKPQQNEYQKRKEIRTEISETENEISWGKKNQHSEILFKKLN